MVLNAIPSSETFISAVEAGCLGVSSATANALCRRGELPHVRVSNAIRLRMRDLEG